MKSGRMQSSKSVSWADTAERDWFNTFFMVFFPIAAVLATGLYFYLQDITTSQIALFVFFYFATGLSITAGYHRLFAHRGYEAHPIIQFIYLVFGAAAFQNSALKWCRDHRVHHLHVDNEDDPYNINQGLWFAHVGWVCRQGNPKNFSHLHRDLTTNKLVAWQDRNFMLIGVTVGFVLPTLLGGLLGSALGGFALAGLLRTTLVHHFTFFINSLSHYWGQQTYTDRNSARDNFFLAFFTYGEGFHNFHHLFSNDYRNGIRWFDFDPTKWAISTLAFFGFASQLKKTPQIQILRARLNMRKVKLERKISCSETLQNWSTKLDQLKSKVEQAYLEMGELREHYRREYQAFKAEKSAAGKVKIEELRADLQAARAEYKLAMQQWRMCTSALMKAV